MPSQNNLKPSPEKSPSELLPESFNVSNPSSKTVFLGMSGGVDSSLSAVLLKEAGFNVVGVYMKNWSRDLPGMKCPWAEDLADAKRVATSLDLDFLVLDFEAEYKEKVVDYMLSEFKLGRTPNPDVLCNEEIKFKLFFKEAKKLGADFIATGHYAGVRNGALTLSKDKNKDQTYFLYRISRESLEKTIFPLENLEKPEVKRLAAEKGLKNAYKKESMGVCFVGEVGIKDFLKEYIDISPGEIRELETGALLGTHEGAVFYTLGQCHGLYIGGGLPYYVVKKDLKNNVLFVSKNLNASALWTSTLDLENVFLRSETERALVESLDGNIFVRLCHRAPLLPARLNLPTSLKSPLSSNPAEVPASLKSSDSSAPSLVFSEEIKRPASGQSVVFYSGTEPGDLCLGGAFIK
ncbi:tRNA 2-thiouridine(34) synthase MnmA [Candidatus Saccharibacteria bacterium]|nr:tRNA 2-thiouridine(34) synthase MnmA [Candidatus Saccharibacteria bacterium]